MRNHLPVMFFATAVLLSPVCAHAQRTMMHNGLQHTRGVTLAAKFKKQAQTTNARTTAATGTRLIAETHLQHDGTSYLPQDSTTYAYTGTRGGYLNAYGWEWNFDNYISYSNSGGTYENAYKEMRTYDVNNNWIGSVTQRWVLSTSNWENDYQQQCTYDGMNRLVTAKDQTWNMGTGTWDSSDRYTATYDISNNLIKVVDESWNAGTSSWDSSYRSTYTYDAAHNQLTAKGELYSLAAWLNSDLSTSTYDASNNKLTELGQNWIGGAWTNAYNYVSSSFSGRQPGTTIEYFWNGTGFDTVNRNNYTYNANNQPVTYYQQSWDEATSTWQSEQFNSGTRYYYETYTTGIKTVDNSLVSATVYPVPAGNEVTIDISWAKAQSFSVTLMDMTGRMYTSYHIPACTQYKDKMSVADLPSGNYIISIESAEGKTSRKISVVK